MFIFHTALYNVHVLYCWGQVYLLSFCAAAFIVIFAWSCAGIFRLWYFSLHTVQLLFLYLLLLCALSRRCIVEGRYICYHCVQLLYLHLHVIVQGSSSVCGIAISAIIVCIVQALYCWGQVYLLPLCAAAIFTFTCYCAGIIFRLWYCYICYYCVHCPCVHCPMDIVHALYCGGQLVYLLLSDPFTLCLFSEMPLFHQA